MQTPKMTDSSPVTPPDLPGEKSLSALAAELFWGVDPHAKTHRYRLRHLLFDLAFFSLLTLFAVNVFGSYFKGRIEEFLEGEYASVWSNYSSEVEHFSQISKTIVRSSIDKEPVKTILRQANLADESAREAYRRKLFDETLPLFREIRDGYGINQMEFHLNGAKSFLRVQNPIRPGEDSYEYRRAVRRIQESGTPMTLFDAGREGWSLRHIYPLYLNGNPAGSVSISERIETLQKVMNLRFAAQCFLVLRKELADRRFPEVSVASLRESRLEGFYEDHHAQSDETSEVIDEDVAQQLAPAVAQGEPASAYVRKGMKFYAVHLIPFKGPDGRLAGFFAAYQNAEGVTTQYHSYIATVVIFLILVLGTHSFMRLLVRRNLRLGEANTLFQSAINAFPHPFFVVSAADHEILIHNERASPTPLPPGTTCHPPLPDCPEDGERHAESCPLPAVLATGRAAAEEHSFADAEGRLRTFEIHGSPIRDSSGAITKFIEYYIDLTEKKEFESARREHAAMMSTVFNHAPIIMMLVDEDGRVESINRTGIEAAALEKRGSLEGLTVCEVAGCAPGDCSGCVLREAYRRTFWDGEGTLKREIHLGPKGRERDYLLSTSYLRVRGTPRVLVSLDDVTEQKAMERDLVKARLDAESANRTKSVFLANMSHEIRTPMNAIVGYAQLMHDDKSLPPELRKFTGIIMRSVNHLLTLINEVLEMSKIEAGRAPLHAEDLDFHALVLDVDLMFRGRAEEKKLALDVCIGPSVPRRLHSDGQKIRQILVNLVGNAVKFTEKGHIRLAVEAAPPDPASGMSCVRIAVEDTGPGIAEEEFDKVFAAFEQTETGRNKGGTGLGMAISRQYACMLGGDLALESELGKGTRVFLTFKAEVRPDAAETAESLRKSRIAGIAAGSRIPRILVVDDVEDNRGILNSVLAQRGFEVMEAADGHCAVETVRRWYPDLVLMDRRMPGMNGLEATRAIKNLPEGRSVPVVMVTASAFEENRRELLEAGVDGYIRKPFRIADVLEEIRRVLPEVAFVYERIP